MYCENCGTLLGEKSNFCAKCGTEVASSVAQGIAAPKIDKRVPNVSQEIVTVRPSLSSGVLKFILATIGGLSLAILFIRFFGTGGLPGVTAGPPIFTPAINVTESLQLRSGDVQFYPIGVRQPVGLYAIKITATRPLDIYVVPSRNDLELFNNHQVFSNYTECQAIGSQLYVRNCKVAQGGGIIMRNPGFLNSELGPTAQLVLEVKEERMQ